MEFKNRKSVFDTLSKYDILAKKEDYIEITEWSNGEGFDIMFPNKSISLTIGELEAIQYLVTSLNIQHE